MYKKEIDPMLDNEANLCLRLKVVAAERLENNYIPEICQAVWSFLP